MGKSKKATLPHNTPIVHHLDFRAAMKRSAARSKDAKEVTAKRLERFRRQDFGLGPKPCTGTPDLELKIAKAPGGYTADMLGLPGSPPFGDGKTREMAVASLFFRLMSYDGYRAQLVEAVNGRGCKLSINGTLYETILPGRR